MKTVKEMAEEFVTKTFGTTNYNSMSDVHSDLIHSYIGGFDLVTDMLRDEKNKTELFIARLGENSEVKAIADWLEKQK